MASWNVCKFDLCESYTARPDGDYCETHRRAIGKASEDEKKSISKRAQKIEKAKAKNSMPRKAISKNPKDWSNTFLCSDGFKITQAEINEKLRVSYSQNAGGTECRGCGAPKTCHAHIIPQARCKQIGKTELIWDNENYFDSCNDCNLAIENPKGEDWKHLADIDMFLAFMKQHDPELFSKFESRLATEPHKI